MNKILSILAVLLSLGATSSSALAEKKPRPNIVDGNPCYEGICIGDSLQSLASLNWQPSSINFKGSKALFQQNKQLGKSGLLMLGDSKATQEALLYIVAGNIQSKSIKAVSRVKYCTAPKALSGVTRINNHAFYVEVKFVSKNNGKDQGYFVSEIGVILPARWSKVTTNQVNNLYADLNQKYPGLLRPNSYNDISGFKGLGTPYPPTVELRPMTLGDDITLVMGSSLKDSSKTQEDLRKMPGCDVFYQDELIRIKVD
jgi:hypothetical protein